MTKVMRKTKRRDALQAAKVKKTAIIIGCSPRQVYRVIDGQQMNEKIIEVYMFLSQAEENIFLQAVNKLVLFN